MIIDDVTGKMEDIIPDSPHAEKRENAPQMDQETQNWPIPHELADEFDGIKYTYQANPLPLYHDNHLVDPSHTNAAINGALVEVTFGIRHWRIQDFDSFQANIHKIVILRPGPTYNPECVKRSHSNVQVEEPESKKARREM
ncbi:hypothetical protein M405DRAFT_845695 [Rhizopogon salebrosus TDB-379]|nr:hypothetical protein M405DRAFT_845695 [Rhizopogon salebrosus TDB-379]